jgi:hypothetical protein
MTVRLRQLLGLTLGAGLLAACAAHWPEENVVAFSRSCLANARKSRPDASEAALVAYCDCAAQRLQAEYSLAEFQALEAESLRTNKPALALVRVVEECGSRVR